MQIHIMELPGKLRWDRNLPFRTVVAKCNEIAVTGHRIGDRQQSQVCIMSAHSDRKLQLENTP